MSKPLVIGHRGDAKNFPENTLKSFQRVLELGADGIELDVQLTKDGHLVVIHDEKVDRTTDGIGFVKDFTLKEIKRLDAGIKFNKKYIGEKIPTLSEVFELIGNKDFLVDIEIKSGIVLYPGIEEKLVKLIYDFDFQDRVLISSFNHYSLRDLKNIAPELKIGLLYECGIVEPWNMAKIMNAYSINPFYFNIIPEVIEGCKRNNIKLFPWTVDIKEDMLKMINAGVDAIITNDPETLIGLLREGE
ncbi:MAG: glycerophosphodiester phosphodiesterase [Thermoanaerobacteraceae bacterium]